MNNKSFEKLLFTITFIQRYSLVLIVVFILIIASSFFGSYYGITNINNFYNNNRYITRNEADSLFKNIEFDYNKKIDSMKIVIISKVEERFESKMDTLHKRYSSECVSHLMQIENMIDEKSMEKNSNNSTNTRSFIK